MTGRSRWRPQQPLCMTFRSCVQAGTRHHFAVDVGVNRHDAPGAIEAFTSGVKRRIDMAEVNGRLYLYGDAVRRPGYRDAKVRTLLETAEACSAPAGRRPRCAWSTTPGASTVSSPSCSCPTTRTRWTARRPALDTGQLGIVVLDVPGDSAPFPGPAPGRAGPGGQCPQIGARGYRR